MKPGQRLWTREEVILAINLYCKIPFGRMHQGNPQVKELAQLIGRTPGSVAYKLVNLASLDPSLQARGIKGASNASNVDKAVWGEFYNNWDAALLESEQILADRLDNTIQAQNEAEPEGIIREGREAWRYVSTRVNQNLFRRIVLATYNNTCCITGIQHSELLVASHIAPWSQDEKNRLNPMNGLCLNSLHDKAFDRGLLTVSAEDYSIHVSASLMDVSFFAEISGKQIRLPDKFLPQQELLKRHNEVFRG